MIRHTITEQEIRASIEVAVPGWLDRAQKRTEAFIKARKYEEASSIWSEVKPVYMKIQHDKCIYCERQLASPDHGGAIEHDLEHFRPKNEVVEWPTAEIRQSRSIDFHLPLGAAYSSG